jgi:hypothetical protein
MSANHGNAEITKVVNDPADGGPRAFVRLDDSGEIVSTVPWREHTRPVEPPPQAGDRALVHKEGQAWRMTRVWKDVTP